MTWLPWVGGAAVRRHNVIEASPERAELDSATATNVVADGFGALSRTTHVDYVVPAPGSDGQLLLSFSTATGELPDELVELVDAMSSTLGCVW